MMEKLSKTKKQYWILKDLNLDDFILKYGGLLILFTRKTFTWSLSRFKQDIARHSISFIQPVLLCSTANLSNLSKNLKTNEAI